MARSEPNSQARTFTLLCGVVAIAVLYVGREILLPLALAILLSFLLAPLVERLERLRVRRLSAVLIVVVVCFIGAASLSTVLGRQLYDMAYRLPTYKQNILEKVEAMRSDQDGVVERVRDTLAEVSEKLEEGKAAAETSQAAAAGPVAEEPADEIPEPEPVLVKVVEELSVDDIAARVLGPVLPPLATAAMVVVFTIFMLLEQEDLRNRFISLVGPHQLHVTTQAIDDASSRVSRYLRMQLIINASYGLVIALGLFVIGLPNALLWGVLTAILRFIPYVGPWIAAAMPIALSLAVFDGWMRPLLVIGLFIVNELVSNNVLEPWLYGASTGLSTIGVLVSALFWTWIWGPVGLVMATPLTVCLTVLGRYVPQMAFIATLLSDEESLPAPSRFYQRLLAVDPDEAMEVAEDYLEETSLQDVYDDVLLPALRLAERDRHGGYLDDEKVGLMYRTLRELVDDLAERAEEDAAAQATSDGDASSKAESAGPMRPQTPAPRETILCLPARDEADEIAGLMLAHIVQDLRVDLRVLPQEVLASEMIEQISEGAVNAVCVSALPPHASTHARYLCKRLRARFPHLQIVVGLWEGGGPVQKSRQRLAQLGINKIVTSLAGASDALAAIRAQRVSNAVSEPADETLTEPVSR